MKDSLRASAEDFLHKFGGMVFIWRLELEDPSYDMYQFFSPARVMYLLTDRADEPTPVHGSLWIHMYKFGIRNAGEARSIHPFRHVSGTWHILAVVMHANPNKAIPILLDLQKHNFYVKRLLWTNELFIISRSLALKETTREKTEDTSGLTWSLSLNLFKKCALYVQRYICWRSRVMYSRTYSRLSRGNMFSRLKVAVLLTDTCPCTCTPYVCK